MIEPVYGMSRPADDDESRFARNNRATYELHDRAGERTSVLFCTYEYETASEILLGGSIYPAMQNFLLAARAQGLGACITSWASYGGEQVLRDAVGIPDEWLLAGHVVIGWPRGQARPDAPPPARRRRRPRPLGPARGGPRRRAHPGHRLRRPPLPRQAPRLRLTHPTASRASRTQRSRRLGEAIGPDSESLRL